MPKFNEETLASWAKPPSDTEEAKLRNAERMIGDCVKASSILSKFQYEVFGQGSYANDTNVRNNSDVDINVRLLSVMHIEVPPGKQMQDYGYTPSDYTFSQFRLDVYKALCDTFNVTDVDNTGNKCIEVKGNTYRVQADVVPTFKLVWHLENGDVVNGSWFISKDGNVHHNYATQHIANGRAKNGRTNKRFKRLSRIIKRIRYKMIDEKLEVSPNITSFLIECLLYNIPDSYYISNPTWEGLTRESIIFIYNQAVAKEGITNWREVSECIYLFHNNRKWSIEDVKNFMQSLWTYLELK